MLYDISYEVVLHDTLVYVTRLVVYNIACVNTILYYDMSYHMILYYALYYHALID